jgi:hypothetical protein
MASREIIQDEKEALRLWNQGIRPSFSSNLSDQLTCGYGRHLHNGEFEYPLYPGVEYYNIIRK